METTFQSNMEHSKATKTIYFDHRGDIRFLVDDTYLVVSSKTMSLISDPWKAMLGPDGAFSEAQPGKDKLVPLPEDDLQALTILLHIAHLQFNKVPRHLEFERLVALAVLTDKYQATQIVRPWLKDWLEPLKETIGKDGYEEWLWIAWEYGLDDIFQRVANLLALGSTADNSGSLVTANGRILTEAIPPGIIENILNVRAVTIRCIFDIVYEYVDRFSELHTNPVCKRSSASQDECHAILFGSLVLGLKKLQLWPEPKHGFEIFSSVNGVLKHLGELRILTCPKNHYTCGFDEEMKARINRISHDMPAVVLDVHRQHLEAQHAKCFPRDGDD